MSENRNSLRSMARPERFELPTLWFEARCSIQLSYGRVFLRPSTIATYGLRSNFTACFVSHVSQIGPFLGAESRIGGGFCSPAPRAAFEQMAMVQESIEHGRHGGAVSEHLPSPRRAYLMRRLLLCGPRP